MWENTEAQSEFIYNDSMQQTAINVGIFGVICKLLTSLSLVAVSAVYTDNPYFPTSSYYALLDTISIFSFTFSILASVGFVGIFTLKGSKLGLFFPLMTLVNYSLLAGIPISYAGISQVSFELSLIIQYAIFFVPTILEVLVIFSIRKKSANPSFLYLYIAFILIQDFFWNAIWSPISEYLLPITSSFGYVLFSFPTILGRLISAYLLLTFFSIERKDGFSRINEYQAESNF